MVVHSQVQGAQGGSVRRVFENKKVQMKLLTLSIVPWSSSLFLSNWTFWAGESRSLSRVREVSYGKPEGESICGSTEQGEFVCTVQDRPQFIHPNLLGLFVPGFHCRLCPTFG